MHIKLYAMRTILNRKTNKIFDLNTKELKRRFLIINVLLILGVVLIVTTLLFLVFNLNRSDIVIYRCLVLILTGLVLVIFYAIEYGKIKNKRNIHNQSF